MLPNPVEMKKLFRYLTFGFLSIALFLFLFFIIGLSVILSALAGVALYFVATGFFVPEESESVAEVKDYDKSNIDSALESGFEKLAAIEKKSFEIEVSEVRDKVGRIYDLCRKILDDITENPNDYYAARQFFNYYLDATNSILEKYVSLQNNREFLAIADESIQKTEALLGTVEIAFQKQLEKLYEDDVMDLDTELKVLAKTIKTEGF